MKKYAILFLVGVIMMTAMVSCKPSSNELEPNSKTAEASEGANNDPVQTNTNEFTDSQAISDNTTTTTANNTTTTTATTTTTKTTTSAKKENIKTTTTAAKKPSKSITTTVTQKPIDKIIDGSDINFNLGVYINDHQPVRYCVSYPSTSIVRSCLELKMLYKNFSKYDYLEKYNKEFFKENALIVMFISEPSGSIRHEFNALKKTNNKLSVEMTTLLPDLRTADMAYWSVILEVKKSDVKCVCKIERINTDQKVS